MNNRIKISKRVLVLSLVTVVCCGVQQELFGMNNANQKAPAMVRKELVEKLFPVQKDGNFVKAPNLDEGLGLIIDASHQINVQAGNLAKNWVDAIKQGFNTFVEDWSRYQCSKACCAYLEFAINDAVLNNLADVNAAPIQSQGKDLTGFSVVDDPRNEQFLAQTKVYQSTVALIKHVRDIKAIDQVQQRLCLQL
jgi:hypothetical protein